MVLQRTIENLRERPKHERQAVAFWIAVAVVAVLIVAWGIYFATSLDSKDLQPVNDAYDQALQQVQTQRDKTPPPPDDTGWVSTAPQTQTAASDASQQIQIIQENPSKVDTGNTGETDSTQY